jgi:hypothetical protein
MLEDYFSKDKIKNISQIQLQNYQQVCHEIKAIRNKLLEITDTR